MRTESTASGMSLRSTKPCARQHPYMSARIENIVIVREAGTPNNFGQKGYLKFENVTMVRLDVRFMPATDTDSRQVPDAQNPDRR